jgi:VWFA-related protein
MLQRRHAIALAGIVLGAVALQARQAQTPPQLPTFRAGSVLVNVDVYPRREGKIVEGLAKTDFEVLEDGKPQAVENFEFIKVAPNTPDAERREPTSIEDGNRQATDPRNRVFVVYLDIFHTSVFGSHYTRQPVMEFLRRTLGPTDLFAVTTSELPATAITFARRTETLEADLKKYWDWGEAERKTTFARSQYEAKLLMCGGGEGLVAQHREDLGMTNLEGLVVRLDNLRDERKNILFISQGWVPRPAASPGASTAGRPSIPTIGVGPGGRLGQGASMSGQTDRAWCDAQSARFASIDYQLRFRNVLTAARRANVAFYTVDVGGLSTGQMPVYMAPERASDALKMAEEYRMNAGRRTDTLMELAHNTDGAAIVNTNDLTTGVRRIADDLSAFYLLRYYSTNTETDGRYRRIEVKVKSQGVKVSARPGYRAPTEAMRKAEAAAASKPATGPSAVDIEIGRLSRLRADARVHGAAVSSPTSLDLVIELASQEVESGRWSDGGAVTLQVFRKDDAASVSATGKIEAGARGTLIKVPVTGGASVWRVKVHVKGAPGPAGEIDETLELETAAPSLIGSPVVYRGGPGPRSPIRPAAEYRFRRTERLHVEWVVAKPLDERGARLLSRRGDALAIPITLTERQDGDRLVLAADLALAPLVDGDYVIELTGGAAGEKAQKLLAIRVVR